MRKQSESNKKYVCVCLLLILNSLLAACATEPAAAPVDDDAELQAFLEYLLEFETDEGLWVDPDEFEEQSIFPEADTEESREQ